MTREEAIEVLESIRMDLITVETSEWMSEKEKRYVDACEMAIEALKVIPDNATNGDVIKALFPNIRIERASGGFYIEPVEDVYDMLSSEMAFTNNWWNSSYRKGVIE